MTRLLHYRKPPLCLFTAYTGTHRLELDLRSFVMHELNIVGNIAVLVQVKEVTPVCTTSGVKLGSGAARANNSMFRPQGSRV